MKNIKMGVLVVCVFALALASVSYALWVVKPSSVSTNLNSVSMLGSNVIYAVGDSNVVIKSTNEGNSWDAITSLVTVNKVKAVSSAVAYAANFTSKIIYKIDGTSVTAIKDTSSDFGTSLDDIFAASENIIFAGGEGSSNLLRTTNGGAAWTATALGGGINRVVKKVYFKDTSNGWLVLKNMASTDSMLYTTIDTGETWTLTTGTIATGTANIVDLFVLDKNHIYVLVNDSPNVIFTYSLDEGTTWTPLTLSGSPVPTDPKSIRFVNSNVGFIACSNGVWRTIDAGANWSRQSSTACESMDLVANPTKAVVVGASGTFEVLTGPTFSSISTNEILAGQTKTVTIEGVGFEAATGLGPYISYSISSITSEAPSVLGSTQMLATIEVGATTVSGAVNISIRSIDETLSTFESAFAVVTTTTTTIPTTTTATTTTSTTTYTTTTIAGKHVRPQDIIPIGDGSGKIDPSTQTTTTIQIEVPTEGAGNYKVKIIGENKQEYGEVKNLAIGRNKVTIPVSNLTNGIHLLTITGPDGFTTKQKIVVLRSGK